MIPIGRGIAFLIIRLVENTCQKHISLWTSWDGIFIIRVVLLAKIWFLWAPELPGYTNPPLARRGLRTVLLYGQCHLQMTRGQMLDHCRVNVRPTSLTSVRHSPDNAPAMVSALTVHLWCGCYFSLSYVGPWLGLVKGVAALCPALIWLRRRQNHIKGCRTGWPGPWVWLVTPDKWSQIRWCMAKPLTSPDPACLGALNMGIFTDSGSQT